MVAKAFVLAALIIIIYFVFRSTIIIGNITSESMKPSLEIGEFVLILRKSPAKWISRGRIVAFFDESSAIKGDFRINVKRVVGLEGDRIEPDPDYLINSKTSPIIIPKGMLFLRGDHKFAGNDSFTFGMINKETVIGIVFCAFKPFSLVGGKTNDNPNN